MTCTSYNMSRISLCRCIEQLSKDYLWLKHVDNAIQGAFQSDRSSKEYGQHNVRQGGSYIDRLKRGRKLRHNKMQSSITEAEN